MESITINLPKKMSLVRRISETGNRVRDWLQTFAVAFNDERDKLQLTKWELKNGEYFYHYAVIKGKVLSAGKVNIKTEDSDPDISDIPPGILKDGGSSTEFSSEA